MKDKAKLVNKVKHLIKKAGLPRWLHRFGPKKYEFWQHGLAYIVKQECKLGYRRVTRLLRGLGMKVPCPSALCMSFKRIPLEIWQMLLQATISSKTYIAAIDGSGWADACYVHRKLWIKEMAFSNDRLQEVYSYYQHDFESLELPENEYMYIEKILGWESPTVVRVELKWTCTEEPLDGIYLLDMTTLTAEIIEE